MNVSFGFSINYKLNNRFSLISNFNYESKGAIGRYNSYIFNQKFKREYLVVPVLSSFSFGEKNKIGFNLGPYIAYLLNDNSSSLPNSHYNSTRNFDLGLVFGLFTKFEINNNLFFNIEIRNNYELALKYRTMSVWNQPYPHYPNESISLMLGLDFILR